MGKCTFGSESLLSVTALGRQNKPYIIVKFLLNFPFQLSLVRQRISGGLDSIVDGNYFCMPAEKNKNCFQCSVSTLHSG